MFVVTQEIWVQSSVDYEAVKKMRTFIASPEMTINDVMDWAEKCNVLARGDIVITKPDIDA